MNTFLLLLIGIPIIEIYLFIKLGSQIGAFNTINSTKEITKCILLGMNNQNSEILDLGGGGPQGSIIGQLLYIIASDDAAEDIPEEDKFKYIDDLS